MAKGRHLQLHHDPHLLSFPENSTFHKTDTCVKRRARPLIFPPQFRAAVSLIQTVIH